MTSKLSQKCRLVRARKSKTEERIPFGGFKKLSSIEFLDVR